MENNGKNNAKNNENNGKSGRVVNVRLRRRKTRQRCCARAAAGQIESQNPGMSLGAIPTLLFMPLAQIENAHNNEIEEKLVFR
jgi:hypothetical protein